MADHDNDGFADRLLLTYTEPIRHRVDRDGVYPFRVVGYKITRIGRVDGKRTMTIRLKEKAKTDPGAEPNVLYDRGRDHGVYDRSGVEARTQTFKDTQAFVTVPAGSALLVVHVEGPGTVSSLDGAFACADSCYAVVQAGVVLLNAEANEGAAFDGWSGACAESGNANQCALFVDADKTVGATFV